MSHDILRRAIDTWHGLLQDTALAEESAAWMEAGHRKRRMYFGERPLCSVLRPRFVTVDQYRTVRRKIETVMGAFRRAHEAAMADPALLAQFHLLDWEVELIAQDPGFASPSPTSRLDAFFDPADESLRFTEYNAETPAGPGYMDNLSEVVMALPAMGEFLQTHVVHPLHSAYAARRACSTPCRAAYAEWSGKTELPRIGIFDWKEVPTYSEFVFFRDYFHSQGVECVIADPREVEYRDGRLMAGDFHVTLIYKRVLIDELVLRMGMDNPVVRAVRDGAVCMVNPFRCKVLYKKASLAVLGDERNEHLFSADERRAVEAHIPWTRIVEERKTRFHGQAIDLLPWIEQNRERLVLKPNDDYGGRGIVLGWLVDDEKWRAAIKDALETPYVAQERIVLPTEPFPSWVDGRVEVYDRMVDIAPFITHSRTMDGALTRIATDPLLNVTAGGGSSVATMLVEPR